MAASFQMCVLYQSMELFVCFWVNYIRRPTCTHRRYLLVRKPTLLNLNE
jgi:hypothetical protein